MTIFCFAWRLFAVLLDNGCPSCRNRNKDNKTITIYHERTC